MCVAGEETLEVSSGGTGGTSGTSGTEYYGGAVPEVVVTADRIGIDMDVFDAIDWTEVLPLTMTGLLGGLGGGLIGGLTGEIAGTLGAIESQEGVDLVDLVEIKNDMVYVPGIFHPYTPLL